MKKKFSHIFLSMKTFNHVPISIWFKKYDYAQKHDIYNYMIRNGH
jgi:hypothetical protein